MPATAAPAKPQATAFASAAGTADAKRGATSSYTAFKQKAAEKPLDRSAYAANPTVRSAFARPANGPAPTYRDYQVRRHTYYTTYYPTYVTPPYAYRSYNHFGIYDAAFLWLMMDQISSHNRDYGRYYYNRMDDPAYREWRGEANRLAADNAELKAKLAAMDAEVAQLKNEPKDPNYQIPGLDPAVTLSEDVVKQEAAPDPAPAPAVRPKPADTGLGWGWWVAIGVASIFCVGALIARLSARSPSANYRV
jgi:hypothetical protein